MPSDVLLHKCIIYQNDLIYFPHLRASLSLEQRDSPTINTNKSTAIPLHPLSLFTPSFPRTSTLQWKPHVDLLGFGGTIQLDYFLDGQVVDPFR